MSSPETIQTSPTSSTSSGKSGNAGPLLLEQMKSSLKPISQTAVSGGSTSSKTGGTNEDNNVVKAGKQEDAGEKLDTKVRSMNGMKKDGSGEEYLSRFKDNDLDGGAAPVKENIKPALIDPEVIITDTVTLVDSKVVVAETQIALAETTPTASSESKDVGTTSFIDKAAAAKSGADNQDTIKFKELKEGAAGVCKDGLKGVIRDEKSSKTTSMTDGAAAAEAVARDKDTVEGKDIKDCGAGYKDGFKGFSAGNRPSKVSFEIDPEVAKAVAANGIFHAMDKMDAAAAADGEGAVTPKKKLARNGSQPEIRVTPAGPVFDFSDCSDDDDDGDEDDKVVSSSAKSEITNKDQNRPSIPRIIVTPSDGGEPEEPESPHISEPTNTVYSASGGNHGNIGKEDTALQSDIARDCIVQNLNTAYVRGGMPAGMRTHLYGLLLRYYDTAVANEVSLLESLLEMSKGGSNDITNLVRCFTGADMVFGVEEMEEMEEGKDSGCVCVVM